MAAAAAAVSTKPFNRANFDEMLTRRFFFRPAFEIYNGVAGLYDLGPHGCAIQANILALWRQHFVLEEQMLEVDCTIMTKDEVFKTSGHVERFTDLMVKDTVTGEAHRADHLLEDHLEKLMADPAATEEKKQEYDAMIKRIDDCNAVDLGAAMTKYKVTSPVGNPISDPYPFNLMFGSQIGPAGNLQGYLRPETAQGMFVNFRFLLDYNNGRMPFAAAQIGRSFRNEIAPRGGLIRVREFTMAEIEHFVHPKRKQHPKFASVANITVNLLPAPPKDKPDQARVPIRKTLGEAVSTGMINNETLGYFLGRIYIFMLKIGIKENRLRFRQHGHSEMAHYASDCWDAEIEMSYGWIECVGCADRSCYDLEHHEAATKKGLFAQDRLPTPVQVEELLPNPNMGVIAKTFQKKAQAVKDALTALSKADVQQLKQSVEGGSNYTLTLASGEAVQLEPSMVSVKVVKKMVDVEDYVPAVIEPSFGIGRILYGLLEHSYYVREEDEQRGVLGFNAFVAPMKVLLAPLSGKTEFDPLLERVGDGLRRLAISYKIDDSSAAIGRRYARADELGIPFAVTVDFQSVKDNTVTLRERDTTKPQVRVQLSEVAGVVEKLVSGQTHWADVLASYPHHIAQDA